MFLKRGHIFMDNCYFSLWIETKRNMNVVVYFMLACDVRSLPLINVHVISDMNIRKEIKFPIEGWLQFCNDLQFNVIKTTEKNARNM